MITIALLKRDIESLKRDNENIRKDIDRISGFFKWFIGIVISMSIGLLSIAISILLKSG